MNMAKKKTLLDLYVVGKTIEFDDGSGDVVRVWLQKLSPLDHETAVRKANAARARVLLSAREPDGDLFRSIENELLDDKLDRDGLVETLITGDLMDFAAAREAEYGAEPEWSDDNYLQGLYDAWEDGLKITYAKDPEDPEAKRVFEALQRFSSKVEDASKAHKTMLATAYEDSSYDDVWGEVLKLRVASHADRAWLLEFRRCEAWLSVRQYEDHYEYYFASRDDIDRLSPVVLRRIVEEYAGLEVPVTEGKGLPETS